MNKMSQEFQRRLEAGTLNPYPEEISDEASGIKVPGEKHRVWMEGYSAAMKDAVMIVRDLSQGKELAEVHCGLCHWIGYAYQLAPVSVPNPTIPGDVVLEPGCPACLSEKFLEYKEEI